MALRGPHGVKRSCAVHPYKDLDKVEATDLVEADVFCRSCNIPMCASCAWHFSRIDKLCETCWYEEGPELERQREVFSMALEIKIDGAVHLGAHVGKFTSMGQTLQDVHCFGCGETFLAIRSRWMDGEVKAVECLFVKPEASNQTQGAHIEATPLAAPAKESCAWCKYYFRRHPPSDADGHMIVRSDGWCGEFAPGSKELENLRKEGQAGS